MKKGLKLVLVLIAIMATFSFPAAFNQHSSGVVYASRRAISLKEGKRLLKKAGYASELDFAKIRSKSKKKTVIVTQPGIHGKDIITLRPKGKYVKIHVIFGSTYGGHFSKISIGLPHNKTVRR
ncbi:hypothetical protein [Levilactobacillus yonginensis]|uniref:hypothetical protein n=1 Tax=Levilactobacillus yonginensis TaxID=1054041 RepID=UPI00345D095F